MRFRQTTGRNVLVSWLGGEPFQWPDWSVISRQFVNEYELDLSITTNGLALQNDRIRAESLELFRQITLSIDGLAEQHDVVRKRPGMFVRLRSVIQQLVNERKPHRNLIRVNTVLMNSNIQTFREFTLTLAKWGVDELTFNPLGGNDRPEFYPANRLSIEQTQQFRDEFPHTKQMAAAIGLRICGTPAYLDRIEATVRGERRAVAECYPGQNFLFVDETGRLSPCSFTAGQFNPRLDPNQSTTNQSMSNQTINVQQWAVAFAQQRQQLCPSACQDCHANHVYDKFR